ncbi:hypothetical protein [Bradyrhizobium neotropicale]|uniref:hypothetical protein n=1 Tax=Bradyrhizobium neotropicale TaxID=1497615 RepID=UPI0011AB713F|nr:hypothetical protein [Bradyrhizobium neotropicale]
MPNFAPHIAFLVSVMSFSGMASGEVPPTLCPPNACEFLVQNFSGTYPSERERARGQWNCWDQNSKTSIACTYVHGDDIQQYSDVYRKKNGEGACNAKCNALHPNSFDAGFDYCLKACELSPTN